MCVFFLTPFWILNFQNLIKAMDSPQENAHLNRLGKIKHGIQLLETCESLEAICSP